MNEIEIDNIGYSVAKPVWDLHVQQQEQIHQLRLHLEREKSKCVFVDQLYTEAKIALRRHQIPQLTKPKDTKYYRYEGVLYLYLDEIQVKHPDTREWYVGVLHADEHGNRYIREIAEFYERFSEEPYSRFASLEEVHRNYIHEPTTPAEASVR